MNEFKKEYTLPREFGEKWLEALRSGDYEQTGGSLCETDSNGNKSFCCLGVAAYMNYTEEHLRTTDFFIRGVFEGNFGGRLKKIPKELKGNTYDNNLVDTLVSMNDNGESFLEIADWIEENVEFYD